MKKIMLIIVILLIVSCNAIATNLRGYVQRYNPYNGTYFPAAGVQIGMYAWNGNGWVLGLTTYTGNDGMYYFLNIIPGYPYKIGVIGGMLYDLPVANQPNQDIPAITI